MTLQEKPKNRFFGRFAGGAAKCLLIALAIFLLFGLSACFRFSDDGWKEYCTPERFLDHAIEHHYITVTSTEMEGEVMDYDLKIKDLILEVGDFTETSKRGEKSEHYISYKILIALSTAGPNYSHLYLYDDGYLEIVYKAALGRERWFYYSFDQSKAADLVEKIEAGITENLQEHSESE